MFIRNILKNLRKWSTKPNRKPLVLRGARQVGKTTIIKQFAKEFDQYIYLNLETQNDWKLFNHKYDINELVKAIFLQKQKNHDLQLRTLLFFDEIQQSPEAVAMLRYFHEETPHLHVICAGSLLESMIDKNIHFPVGRVEFEFMHPLSFDEFLLGNNHKELHEIITSSDQVPNYAHETLKSFFHQYTAVGGMPEVIATFLATNQDFHSLSIIYQNLMLAYSDDVPKYAQNDAAVLYLRHAIEQAPFEAGKRIKFHGFGHSNYGSKEMGEALRTIEKAMLIKLIYPTTNLQLPIVPNYKKSPKLQFLDTGLMNFNLGIQSNFISLNDLNAIHAGMITEHIVLQEVIAANIIFNQKLCFWVREKPQANAEIDLVLPYKNSMIPIEIKAGKTGKLRSLHQFIDETKTNFAVRLYGDFIQLDELKTVNNNKFRLLNLPYYLAGQIMRYIELFNT